MKSILMQIFGFIVIIAIGVFAMKGIEATAQEEEEKEVADNRPIVSVATLEPIDHQVTLTGFGEVVPLESTSLAAQVSGEIQNWNENFVAGGIVKRGEVLFTIEQAPYESAVLQAEAQVSIAEATLVEELARQKVAEREAKNLPANQVSDLYLRKPQVISARAQLKSAEASLRTAKLNLDKTLVKSPYDALVVSRDIGSGQFVNAGSRVAELNNIERAEIMVPIAGFDSPFLANELTGLGAIVTTQGRNTVDRGGVIHRSLGLVDRDTRMQHLVVRVNDPYAINANKPVLIFGHYVKVTFRGRVLEDVYKIPQSLVTNNRVWLVDEEDKLTSVEVNVIRDEGKYFFIDSGLKQSDRVAKSLPEYPQNGMEVRVLDAVESKASVEEGNNAVIAIANQ